MGLARDGDDLLAVTQGASAALIRLSRHYQVKDVRPLDLVRDAHSLAVKDGIAYIASSGNDAVVAFDPRRGAHIFWHDNPSGRDTIHLNSVLWNAGNLYATAFGRKKSADWRSAEDGYLRNLTTGRVASAPLNHPHSACVIPGAEHEGIYFCESQRMAVGREDGERLHVGTTYTRGLVATRTHFYVGFSRSRLTSRSMPPPESPRAWIPGDCGVRIYQRGHGPLSASRPVATITLEEYGQEVYDLLLL
jgi:hypothetical protein